MSFQVGSGKSSLLNTVIGETHVISGSISSCGSIAYVPQVALYDLEIAYHLHLKCLETKNGTGVL
jgi:ABC-type Mn2+/Zn2+ transport system ATPase subunit